MEVVEISGYSKVLSDRVSAAGRLGMVLVESGASVLLINSSWDCGGCLSTSSGGNLIGRVVLAF